MEFEWDEVKDARNHRERGIGFADGTRIFAGKVVEQIDDRRDYGEERLKATGAYGHALLTVVYTQRGDIRRIISVRLASRKERMQWHSSE